MTDFSPSKTALTSMTGLNAGKPSLTIDFDTDRRLRAAAIVEENDLREKILTATLPDEEIKRLLLEKALDLRGQGRSIRELKRALEQKKKEKRRIENIVCNLDAVIVWLDKPAILERCDEPLLADLIVSGHYQQDNLERDNDLDIFMQSFKDAHSILVQHDWASAFKNAYDFEGAELRLPHDKICFEFKISGHQVLFLARGEDGVPMDARIGLVWENFTPFFGPYSYAKNAWKTDVDAEKSAGLIELISRQIYCICAALDAEIAVAEPIRRPHLLNRLPAGGPQPQISYHIISLASRRHAQPLGEALGKQRRLHFRRGHWRHYQTHKTWIKWMLVGNPDLGFVDKDYRL